MTILFQHELERTLDALVSRFSSSNSKRIEAWTFDDEPSRRRAEARLRDLGVNARIRSAYKPLLHFFLEEVNWTALEAAHVIYPVHSAAPANRFLLEAYPLSALAEDLAVTFEASTGDALFYEVSLTFKDGGTAVHKVFAPNHLHQDMIGETSLSPTGWVAVDGDAGSRLETDYEILFHSAMKAIAAHDWGVVEPYFEELSIAVTLPIEDRALPYGDEVISLREGLQEDFYFSLLEFFQRHSGKPVGDRTLRPGQIVPDIRYGEKPSVRVEMRPLSSRELEAEHQPLDTAVAPLPTSQIKAELQEIGGHAFTAATRAGRSVDARYRRGTDRPIIISGGQHANETTGVVGALRAARQLAAMPNAHFVISPLENPDGYQIHWRLRENNPRHMHHAARYTAHGDDLEYRSAGDPGEKAIRHEAERLTGSWLHVNLHGYPSHEWTRPLSGYIPRGFAMWTIPRGFFLIMRHHAAWAKQAEQVLDHVTRRLMQNTTVVEMNRQQKELFELYAGDPGFRMINGFPCLVSVVEHQTVPLTMITEYPDETIYGEAFIDGHTAQMQTVLAAYDAAQMIPEPEILVA